MDAVCPAYFVVDRTLSGNRRGVNPIDRLFQYGVELRVALARAQILRECTREAGDEAVIACELLVRLALGVAAACCAVCIAAKAFSVYLSSPIISSSYISRIIS